MIRSNGMSKETKRCNGCSEDKKSCDFPVEGQDHETGQIIFSEICQSCYEGVIAATEEAADSCRSVSKKGVKKKVGVKKVLPKVRGDVDPEDLERMGRSLAACVDCEIFRLDNYDEQMFILDTGINSPLD